MTGETFSALLMPHLQPMRRMVRGRLRNDQADDVVQQALLRAFRSRHQLRSHDKFRSWLWTIAINEIRMFLRGAHPSVPIEEVEFAHLVDHQPSPHAICEEHESARRMKADLKAGLAQLSHVDRVTIRMVDLDQMTVAKAAQKLGLSAAGLKSRHFRARLRLARALRRRSIDWREAP
jgi:RNA polymerase sigma-70 factor (ECF subfamily)